MREDTSKVDLTGTCLSMPGIDCLDATGGAFVGHQAHACEDQVWSRPIVLDPDDF